MTFARRDTHDLHLLLPGSQAKLKLKFHFDQNFSKAELQLLLVCTAWQPQSESPICPAANSGAGQPGLQDHSRPDCHRKTGSMHMHKPESDLYVMPGAAVWLMPQWIKLKNFLIKVLSTVRKPGDARG